MGNHSKLFLAGVVAALLCLLSLGGCGTTSQNSAPGQGGAASAEETAKAAYAEFLSGDRTLLDGAQADVWAPDFQEESVRYEYTYLDLNGDGVSELLIQMEDDPGGYNGVFHFEDGRLSCWSSDAAATKERRPFAGPSFFIKYNLKIVSCSFLYFRLLLY